LLDHRIYVFNPALVQGLKRVYADAGKTDRLDAFFIAERLRVGRLPDPFQPDLVYAPLQRLTRFRMHLAETLAREKNYCLALLFLPFSAFREASPLRRLVQPDQCGNLGDLYHRGVGASPLWKSWRLLSNSTGMDDLLIRAVLPPSASLRRVTPTGSLGDWMSHSN
jgi:hypothetical protein